jgi:hypothetical protein
LWCGVSKSEGRHQNADPDFLDPVTPEFLAGRDDRQGVGRAPGAGVVAAERPCFEVQKGAVPKLLTENKVISIA